MYYVYLISLSLFVYAVVLCGIVALLFYVIPFGEKRLVGSHTEHIEKYYPWSYKPMIEERAVDDYKKCLVMPIKSKEGSLSRQANSFILIITAGLVLLLSIITGIGGGISMARAEADYYRYADIYNMYYTMYDNGQDLANIGFTQQVISYNNWLVGARANLETYGRYSKWYGYDLYSLKYITMRGDE